MIIYCIGLCAFLFTMTLKKELLALQSSCIFLICNEDLSGAFKGYGQTYMQELRCEKARAGERNQVMAISPIFLYKQLIFLHF